MKESKIGCILTGPNGESWNGQFQLQEHVLHKAESFAGVAYPEISLWGGEIDLACTFAKGFWLGGEDVIVKPADERQGLARVLASIVDSKDHQGGRVYCLAFVAGLTALCGSSVCNY